MYAKIKTQKSVNTFGTEIDEYVLVITDKNFDCLEFCYYFLSQAVRANEAVDILIKNGFSLVDIYVFADTRRKSLKRKHENKFKKR